MALAAWSRRVPFLSRLRAVVSMDLLFGPFGLGPARVSFFFPHIIRVFFLFLFERELVGESSAPENLCCVVRSPLAQRAVATLTRAVQG